MGITGRCKNLLVHAKPPLVSSEACDQRGQCLFRIQPDIISLFLHGQVAQSVEQRTENPCVGGSIPPLATHITKAYSNPAASLIPPVGP
jgi:hypothetical protein